jgi:hypothetical protein
MGEREVSTSCAEIRKIQRHLGIKALVVSVINTLDAAIDRTPAISFKMVIDGVPACATCIQIH